jgi:hypothetical protein
MIHGNTNQIFSYIYISSTANFMQNLHMFTHDYLTLCYYNITVPFNNIGVSSLQMITAPKHVGAT